MTADANAQLNAALSGRYTIERELGAGGMATVYLAHDVRHHRKVALKVLRPELSAILGAERFLAEIKTTANLQHPHILSLFDSGEADGTVFYVMPYVEGESLRDRLKREQQLPVDEAVRVAREVLDALEYAHQHGIVHRDIKPENILLHGGHAMVADFGIALAASKVEGSTRMTETGMSLGTPHYMSPEQAMGERIITAKADIYALGCVLYEMLTGEPPFTGSSAQAVFARMLTDEPRSLTLQRKTIPLHVADAAHTALQKLPADRFATAAEFAAALSGSGVGPRATAAATARGRAAAPRRDWRTVTIAAAAGLVVGAAGLLAWNRASRADDAPPREVRFTLTFPDSARYQDTFGRSIAISPDGAAIAYAGGTAGRRQLFLRRLNDPKPIPLPGTADAYLPFFSPDGEWVGFVANQRILKVRLAGGMPLTVTQLLGNTVSGATWSTRDQIVLEDVTGLSRVSAAGGRLEHFVQVDSLTQIIEWPTFLPDGDAVLCTATRAGAQYIGVATMSDGRLTVFEDIPGTDPRVLGPGLVAWTSSEGVMLAAPFDEKSRRFTGPPKQLLDGIILDGNGAKIAVGPGIAVRVEGGARGAQLLRLDRRGAVRPERPEQLNYLMPRFSPDGRKIAVLNQLTGAAGGELWIIDRARGTRQRLALDAPAHWPEWSRDGRQIALGYLGSVSWDVYSTPADGSGRLERLVVGPQTEAPIGWSPRGVFAFSRVTSNRGDLLYLDSAGAEHAFAATAADERAASLSPDGRFIAYVSDHTGTREVYVRPFPTGDGRWQISHAGGVEPRWSKNGREIIYRDGELFLAVPIVTSGAISVGGVDTLFRGPYQTNTGRAVYDISSDGSEIIIVGAVPEDRALTVWLNPFRELRYQNSRR